MLLYAIKDWCGELLIITPRELRISAKFAMRAKQIGFKGISLAHGHYVLNIIENVHQSLLHDDLQAVDEGIAACLTDWVTISEEDADKIGASGCDFSEDDIEANDVYITNGKLIVRGATKVTSVKQLKEILSE